MSLVQEILYIVSNYPGGYRVIYDMIYDSQPPASRRQDDRLSATLRTTLSRLKKRGLVTNAKGVWSISRDGRNLLMSKKGWARSFGPTRKLVAKGPKCLMVTFDIPEVRRRSRDWLRNELVAFGFELIQKSVWFGPALPREFIEHLSEVGLTKYIRFFKVSEKDLV